MLRYLASGNGEVETEAVLTDTVEVLCHLSLMVFLCSLL